MSTVPPPPDPNLIVSILGPPNAGKSTLYNRLMDKKENRAYQLMSEKKKGRGIKMKKSHGRVGSNQPLHGGAIVTPVPGTTRDRRECVGSIGSVFFTLVDTAGVDAMRLTAAAKTTKTNSKKYALERQMVQQALKAAESSDLVLLMFDARIGITSDLLDTARWLRKSSGEKNRKILILANKLEGGIWQGTFMEDNLVEVAKLGLGMPMPVSAIHGEGMAELATEIHQLAMEKRVRLGLPPTEEEDEEQKEEDEAEKRRNRPLQLAILGRQNVGKSTLVNMLLDENRVLTGETPGLTRDAIAIKFMWKDRPVQIVDTAGIRRMLKRSDDMEDMAVRDAIRAMKLADVAVLVLDAEANKLQRQELAIADAIVREGRALVVVANKMDLLVDTDYTARDYANAVRENLEQRFAFLRNTPILPMSALTGEKTQRLLPTVFKARDRWERVLGTGLLNSWVADITRAHEPPRYRGGRVPRIKYMVQTKGRPPTFLLYTNVPELPESYIRYLTRQFQEDFEYYGMEVRLVVKKSENNPFHQEKVLNKGVGLGGKAARIKRWKRALAESGAPPPKRERIRRAYRSFKRR